MRANRSAAAPDWKAVRIRSAPSSGSEARPLCASASAPSATVTSQSRPSISSPVRKRTAFAISSALPAADASGSFMSVISARVGQPAPFATSTRLRASARASSSVAMNAPDPHLMSRISASSPAASFFDRIEAVIRSIDSTVAVTSRMA